MLEIGTELLRYLAVSGFFVTVALVYNGALQGTGDTKSPLYISLVSQIAIPLGYCAVMDAAHGLRSGDIWLAIVLGHFFRCALGRPALPPGQVAQHPRRHRHGAGLTDEAGRRALGSCGSAAVAAAVSSRLRHGEQEATPAAPRARPAAPAERSNL